MSTRTHVGIDVPGRARERAQRRVERDAVALLPNLYCVALRLTQDSAGAEALVLESYLEVRGSCNGFDGDSNLKVRLFRALTEAFFGTFRPKSQRVGPISDREVEDSNLHEPLHEPLGGDAPGTSAADALLRPQREDVGAALESLPVEVRLIVMLADLEGFSYGEISNVMSIPAETVMFRLRAGRRALEMRLWEVVRERVLDSA